MTGEGAVDIRNLDFGYRRHDLLFDEVSVRLEEFPCVLLGPNGAGKSTLIDLLAGGLRPSRGEVAIGRASSTSRAGRHQLRSVSGWLPQDVVAMPGMTCKQQVAYAGWLKGVRHRTALRRAGKLLERVGLHDYANRSTRELSGGQRRRLGIAQSLVHNPRILLLDEPYAGLDPEQRASVRETMIDLSRDTNIIVSTHQTDDVRDVYRWVVVIDRGLVAFSGTIDEFFDHAEAGIPGPIRAESAYRTILGRNNVPQT